MLKQGGGEIEGKRVVGNALYVEKMDILLVNALTATQGEILDAVTDVGSKGILLANVHMERNIWHLLKTSDQQWFVTGVTTEGTLPRTAMSTFHSFAEDVKDQGMLKHIAKAG